MTLAPLNPRGSQFAVLEFDKPIIAARGAALIGSRLDADIHLNTCRLAFSGRLLTVCVRCVPCVALRSHESLCWQGIDFADAKQRERIKIFKIKERTGAIDRVRA